MSDRYKTLERYYDVLSKLHTDPSIDKDQRIVLLELAVQIHSGMLDLLNKSSCQIADVIFDKSATIIVWGDGTKTVVKAHDEPIDHEKGLAIAITKRVTSDVNGHWKAGFERLIESAEQDECDRIVSKAMKSLRKIYSAAYEKAFRKYVTERLVEDGYSIEEIGLEPGYLTETAYSECVLKAHKKAAHTAMRNRRKYISTETGLSDTCIDQAIQTEIEKYQQHMMTQA